MIATPPRRFLITVGLIFGLVFDNVFATRLVTREELAEKNGENGNPIWLSIMGDIFDVSAGKDYYGKGSAYGVFAGRDASVSFITGVFTDDEAEKGLEVVNLDELSGLLTWHEFYRDHGTYTFVGHLIDHRYYDEDGSVTYEMQTTLGRIETVKEIQKSKVKRRPASSTN